MPNQTETMPAVEAGGASAGAWQQNPAEMVNAIRLKIVEVLQLDPQTVARIYENEKEYRMFEVTAVEDEEMFVKIGPSMCVEQYGDECYVEIALTVSEAIALALRLIRYAIDIYMREKTRTQ